MLPALRVRTLVSDEKSPAIAREAFALRRSRGAFHVAMSAKRARGGLGGAKPPRSEQ